MTSPLPDLLVKFRGDLSDLAKDVAEVQALLDGVGKGGKGAGDDVDQGMKKASKAVQDFDRLVTKNLSDERTAWQTVQKSIADTKTRIADLQKQTATTGSSGLFGDLKKAQADLKTLEGYLKDMGDDSNKITENIKKASDEGDRLGSVFVQMGIAASPFLAPVAAGSLLALLGGGGLALGIAGQFSSPVVQGALSMFKANVGATLKDATAGYDTELAGSLATLDSGVRGFLEELKPGLQAIRPELQVISQDVAEGLDAAGASFSSALSRSRPVLSALGASVKTLLTDTGTAFDHMSTGASGASRAITDLTSNVGQLEVAAGDALGTLSQAYGALASTSDKLNSSIGGSGGMWTDIWNGIKNGAEDAINPVHGAEDAITGLWNKINGSKSGLADWHTAAGDAADAAAALTRANQTLMNTFDKLKTSYDQWIGDAQSKDDALLNMKQAQSAFNQTLQDTTHNWDLNTQSGQKLFGAFNQLNEGITGYYDKLLALEPHNKGLISDELNAEQALYKQAKAAGASDSELSTLKGTIQKLQDELDVLNGKKIVFYVNQVDTVTYTNVSPQQWWHGGSQGGINVAPYRHAMTAHAQGGLDYAGARAFGQSGIAGGMRAFANSGTPSGVYSGGPTQSLIKFAEPSTRGEAYIARNGNIGGQISALQTAVGWLSERSPFGGSATTSNTPASPMGPMPDVTFNSVIVLDNAVVARSQSRANLRELMRSGTSGQA